MKTKHRWIIQYTNPLLISAFSFRISANDFEAEIVTHLKLRRPVDLNALIDI